MSAFSLVASFLNPEAPRQYYWGSSVPGLFLLAPEQHLPGGGGPRPSRAASLLQSGFPLRLLSRSGQARGQPPNATQVQGRGQGPGNGSPSESAIIRAPLETWLITDHQYIRALLADVSVFLACPKSALLVGLRPR